MKRQGRQVRRAERPPVSSGPTYRQKAPKTKSRQMPPYGKYLLWAIIMAVLLGGLWWFGKVQRIDVNPQASSGKIVPILERALSKPFWNQHLLFIRSDRLSQQLLNEYPDVISSIDIQKQWLNRAITVNVDVRRPIIRWQSGGEVYGVDQKGVVVRQLSGGELGMSPLVKDSTNLRVKIGRPVAPSRFISFVLACAKRLQPATGLKYVGARILDTTNEIYIDTDGGFYLRLDSTRQLEPQLKALKAILNKGASPTLYVDLRLPHKAYYR